MLFLGFVAGCAKQTDPPNVLLVTIDTLRADRLSGAGYERETTPNLDALGREGLVFTHATSPRAKTTPAIASLLTGLYPHDHGVRDLSTPISEEPALVGDVFRSRGYSTFAILGNWVLIDRRSGLARGFQSWTEDLPDLTGVPPNTVPQRTARSLTDGALQAAGLRATDGGTLAGPFEAACSADAPWFGWLHYMDPHGLYDPPSEHDVFGPGALDPIGPVEAIPPSQLHRPRIANYNVPPDARLMDGRIDAARVRDRYDGEVRYVDAELGRLLDELDSAGSLANTIVAVTSDHGESLGEHLYWFEHGLYTYEATTRVPLILRLPGALRDDVDSDLLERGVFTGDVSLVDLAPTLLDLCDLPRLVHRRLELTDPTLAGRSLVPDLRSGRERRRPVFSEQVERSELAGLVHKKSVRVGNAKLIRRYTFARPLDLNRPGAERDLQVLLEEFYDLESDPHESQPLDPDDLEAASVAQLRDALDGFFAADRNLDREAARLQRRRESLEREEPRDLRYLDLLGYGGEH